ncbi:acyltransferase [Polaribacter butkevichii]|uniref:acyltransferase n=1 Tax=Polaribacter butkevichii TaxID=218490 RepID=UPI000CF5637A|nr:acyltransferase [Polaribacter butkevichii]
MIRKIVEIFAHFVSLFFNYSLIKYWKFFINNIYSYSVKRRFKKCGNNTFIEAPIYIEGARNITIGNDFYCFKRLRIEAYEKHLQSKFKPVILIGNNVSINYDCHIGCINKIVLGDNVLIGSRVFITDHYHGDTDNSNILDVAPNKRQLVSKGPVIIESNVWIGEGVSIMPNVTIGKNSIIGANAVVTKSFPANSIIGGVPAKLIKKV